MRQVKIYGLSELSRRQNPTRFTSSQDGPWAEGIQEFEEAHTNPEQFGRILIQG